MKRFRTCVLCLAVIAGTAFVTTPAGAANRCANPQGTPDFRACAKAMEGADALRRFVERTRGVYGLYYNDYARDESTAVASEPHVDAERIAAARTTLP